MRSGGGDEKGKKNSTRPPVQSKARRTLIGIEIPIQMHYILLIRPEDNSFFKKFRQELRPSESVRAVVRRFKPIPCCNCGSETLHGNGWRCRSVLKSWKQWNPLWYWRVECQNCGASHRIIPEIVIPDLLYEAETVAKVLVGRLSGKKAQEFEPDQRTQKRWLDRIRSNWPVAQSVGAIEGTLKEWSCSVSSLMKAIHRCASYHVGLFFPSRAERLKTGASPRRKYPAIATHQMCRSAEVLRL